MSNFDIVRAWKDEKYRNSLSSEEQALLPANPAGDIELSDDLLAQVSGGEEAGTAINFTAGCCGSVYHSCYWYCVSTPTMIC